MLLFMKGNIDCLVQERASLSSGSGNLSSYNRNTDSGLTAYTRRCSMHFSCDNNPMREIRLLSPFY